MSQRRHGLRFEHSPIIAEVLEDRALLTILVDISPMADGLNVAGNLYTRDHAVGLSGANEMAANTSAASGNETGAGIVYDEVTNMLSLDFAYGSDDGFVDLEGEFSASHIHGSGSVNFPDANTSAGVLINLVAEGLHAPGSSPRTGAFSGTVTLTDAQEEMLLNNGLYINIHSTAVGSGEIRGQLIPVASTDETHVALTNGDLTITDVGTATDDQLTLIVNGDNLEISSAAGTMSGTGTNVSGSGTTTITIPLADITGSLTIHGGDGDDSLTVDFSGGNPLPASGLIFNGGSQATAAGDALTILGTFTTQTITFTDTTGEGHDGSINLDSSIIVFTGLEPITAGNAADTILNLPTSVANTATLQDNATAGQIEIVGATFEDTVIPNPTNSLTINLGDQGDILGVTTLDAAYAASVIITGGAGADDVDINNVTISSTPGRGLDVSGVEALDIAGSEFSGNMADVGAGLRVIGGTASITNTSFLSNTATGNAATEGGGGIYSDGTTLTLTDVTITGNLATGTSGSGGGLFVTAGTVSILNSTLAANAANRAGGGIEIIDGVLNLTNSHLLNNDVDGFGTGGTPNPGNGGGLHVTGAAFTTIDGGSVFGNVAGAEGGGLWNQAGAVLTIQNGTLISGNMALGSNVNQGGGGIFNRGGDVIVDGSVARVIISGNFADGARGSGGGILNVNAGAVIVNDADIIGNEALGTQMGDGGGGILNIDGIVSVTSSLIDGNVAGGTSGSGGGILSRAGILVVTDSTISANTANRAGGGIEVGRADVVLTNVVLGGTTVADGNSVAGPGANPGNGGGLHATFDSVVTITGGSVSNNSAIEGGGLWNSATGTLNVDGTVIENNTAVIGGGVYTEGDSNATVVRVEVQNLAPDAGPTDSGLFLTPLFAAFHDGTFDTFSSGAAASVELERLAEDGDTMPLSAAFAAAQMNGVYGTFPGLLAPGDLQSQVFSLDGISNRYFNYATMVIPSNDAFLGNDDPTAFELFDASGNFLGPIVFTVAGSRVWDAGTEQNTESDAAFFDQMAPDTGAAEGGTVMLHPGFNGSVGNAAATPMNILGGTQMVGPGRTFGVTNADFTTPNYNVLRVSIIALNAGTTLNNVTINGNTATGDAATEGGGGIYNDGGTLTITGSTISNNLATGASGSGGGIFSTGGTVTVTDTNIEFNEANRAGGGIEVIDGTVILTTSNLTSNIAGPSGPAAGAPGNGGGLHVSGMSGTSVTVSGGSVFGNEAATEGGGLWNQSGSTLTVDSGTLIDGNMAFGDASHDGGGGIFNNGGTVVIDGSAGEVTISNNFASGVLGSGGGIFNNGGGTLVISDAAIIANEAERAGGGIEDAAGAGFGTTLTNVTLDNNLALGTGASAPGNGGGLHITGAGDVVIEGGTVSGNMAALEGGGLWNGVGTMTITGGTFISGNTASGDAIDDGGGGIFNNGGTLTITGATISNNLATGTSGSGGGIFSTDGMVTIADTTISLNAANRAGGGIEIVEGLLLLINSNLVSNDVDGAAGTANPGNGGGLHITGAADATIDGGSVFGNNAASEGGGLWNNTGTLTIQNGTVIDGNSAFGNAATNGGGGIFNNGGTLVIEDATITNNFADGTSGSGGGIFNDLSGTVTIMRTTLSGNEASRAGGAIEDNSNASIMIFDSTLSGNVTSANPGNGGALHITANSGVTIVNSTISGNTAAKEGGGLWNSATGTLTVQNATITGNTATAAGSGGGVFTVGGGATILTNTIVAGNEAAGTANDIAGATVSGMNNLIGDAASSGGLMDGMVGNVVGNNGSGTLDITLILNTMLADNGGPTLTHALVFGSQAVDAGLDLSGLGITTDQRGVSRPQGAAFDIGAIELTADVTSPTSSVVRPASFRVNTKTFSINIVGTDAGQDASGIDRFELYVRTNARGPFALFTTVNASPGASPGTFEATTTFTAMSRTIYQFASLAVDRAGNRETGQLLPDALFLVGDVDAPQSQVDSAVMNADFTTSGLLSVTFSGTDVGGQIRRFDVFVAIDGGAPINAGRVNGSAGGMLQIQAAPGTHDYRFFTVATDTSGNVEATPTAPLDVTLTAVTFTPPAADDVVNFDVQNNATQRSFINELDVTLTSDAVAAALAAAGSGRAQLVNTGLDGTGNTLFDLSAATFTANGSTLTLLLGSAGLTVDGVYELRLDLDDNGTFETVLTFHRIQGDADGDGDVDSDDINKIRRGIIFRNDPDADVNGDGVVNVLDFFFARTNFGAMLDLGIDRNSLSD